MYKCELTEMKDIDLYTIHNFDCISRLSYVSTNLVQLFMMLHLRPIADDEMNYSQSYLCILFTFQYLVKRYLVYHRHAL